MDSDQESLLARHPPDKTAFNLSNRPNNMATNQGSIYNRTRRNLLLITILVSILICLSIYFYLNMQAISNIQSGPSDSARFKPLSRRKPMLDHESIFSDSGPSMLRLSDLLAHCIVALQIAGKKVVDLSLAHNDKLNLVGSKGKTKEGVDDILTNADMESHRVILNTIKDSYRRLRIVSEEDNSHRFVDVRAEKDLLPINRQEFAEMLRSNLHQIEGQHADRGSLVAQHETLVWIDPLDATKEYSENLTDYVTLMACIVHQSQPIAGVIYKPFTNQLYWSMKDHSTGEQHHSPDLAILIDSRTKTKSGQQLKVIVSRSHAGDVKNVLHKAYGDGANIISAGGSGYKTIEVIKGSADVYVHLTRIKKWDVCAPSSIIQSIKGGRFTDLLDRALTFGDPKDNVIEEGLVASLDGTTHKQLVKLIGEAKLKLALKE